MRLAPLVLLAALAGPGPLAAGLDSEPAANAAEREDARLPFIADDYAKALGEARARSLPLFVEAWAPW